MFESNGEFWDDPPRCECGNIADSEGYCKWCREDNDDMENDR